MKKPQLLLLILIIILALFFRTFKVIERADFGHDADLFSWIVKDIALDGHLRLVGQETSASGIFIGPLFYYLLVPFFLLFKMDPVAVLAPITIIGILTVISYYFVFTKLFNINVGLIISFLYAVLLSSAVWFDTRWAPSTPTNLWVIWYFYTIVMISRGNFRVLPILGVLIGLIWHIHIALLPALSALPAAFLISKKLPNPFQVTKFLIALLITSLPFIVFELRHDFKQTLSLIQNFTTKPEGVATGFYKFQIVVEMITKNINSLLFAPQSFKLTNNIFFPISILLGALWLMKKGLVKLKELIPLYLWILGVVTFFSLSSSPISEYYFNNIEIIFLAIISLFLYQILKSSNFGKVAVLTLLVIIASKNIYSHITVQTYHKGYVEKKAIVDYIISEANKKNFPCFSINYITSTGENVGFRYFFFLKNTHIAVAGRGSPVYSIVIPDEYSAGEIEAKYGHIGVIPPKEIPSKEIMKEACSGQNTNLTEPMFGYVE